MATSPKLWDTASEQQYKNELTRVKTQFDTNKTTLLNRAPAVVLGIQDAQSAVSSAKSNIESGISLLQTRDNELKSKLKSLLNENTQSANKIQMLEEQIKTNKSSVTEAETLATLRKEQADDLRRKGEGNFHSSWMGLWRPLSEQSRLGLIIATVFFGIVFLIMVALYAKQLFPILIAYFGIDPDFSMRDYVSARLLQQNGAGRRGRQQRQ
jgi:hypothetical protein